MAWHPSEEDIILEVVHGSNAYGLAGPNSDLDLRGVAIAPLETYLGFQKRFDQDEQKVPDRVVFDLQKFMHLACQNNPNVLEMLYVPSECVRTLTEEGQVLMDIRDRFLSRKVLQTFLGYAKSQYHKVKCPSEDEFSYDHKHMSHCLRLIQQMRTLYQTGVFVIRLSEQERERLIQIKRGEVPWSEVNEEYQTLLGEVQGLEVTHPLELPDHPPVQDLNRVCSELIAKKRKKEWISLVQSTRKLGVPSY